MIGTLISILGILLALWLSPGFRGWAKRQYRQIESKIENRLVGQKARVLISYSTSADTSYQPEIEIIRETKKNLKQLSIKPILDPKFAQPNPEEWSNLLDYLNYCDYMIFLISANSFRAPTIQNELEIAIHNRRHINPGTPQILMILIEFDMRQLLAEQWYKNQTENLNNHVQIWKFLPEVYHPLPPKCKAELVGLEIKRWIENRGIALNNYLAVELPRSLMPAYNNENEADDYDYPQGLVSPNSQFYIPTVANNDAHGQVGHYEMTIGRLSNRIINSPNNYSVVRIRCPKYMGKSSFLSGIIQNLSRQGHKAVCLDLSEQSNGTNSDLSQLLKSLCIQIASELGYESTLSKSKIDDIWNETLPVNQKFKKYLENFLLPSIDSLFILGLDNVDRIFTDKNQADSFFSLFRSIIDGARRNNGSIYNKLRLIFSYSTQDISNFASDRDPMHSPFNIGRAVSIAGFDERQIEELSQNAYELNLSPEQLTDLKRLVGGHPYLIQIALSELKKNEQTPGYFDQLMEEAATDRGIYRIHLADLYIHLQKQPELLYIFQRIILSEQDRASSPIFRKVMRLMPGVQDFNQDRDIPQLQSALESLGLVKFQDDQCVPRCQLYQDYFQEKLETL